MITLLRLQSAMEYLMTYGWVILVIAVVLGALFSLGVFSGTTFSAQACIPQPGYICSNPLLNTSGYLTVTFGEVGSSITITGLNCTTTSAPPTALSPVSAIQLYSGEQVSLTFQCPLTSNTVGTPFAGSLYIQYNSGPYSGVVAKVASAVAKVSTKGTLATSTSTTTTSTSTSTTTTSTSTSTTTTSTSTSTTTILPLALDGSNSVFCNGCSSQTIGITTTGTSDVIVVVEGVSVAKSPATCATSTPTATGLTFSLRTNYSTSTIRMCEYYATTTSAQNNKLITIPTNTAGATTVIAFGVSGASTSTPFDTSGTLPVFGGTGGTTHCSPTFSTSVANDLIFGYDTSQGAGSYTAGSGYTGIQTSSGNGWNMEYAEYKIVSSTQSSINACMTLAIGENGATGADAIQ